MAKTLIETITDKAEKTFLHHPITTGNFELWRSHWIKTGSEWQQELASEGLVETAAKVSSFVEEEKLRKYPSYGASFCWANFKKMVYYGHSTWPSYSYWIVPGTITDEERF